MDRKPAILILAFFISVVPTALVFAAGTAHKTLLRDGFVLTGVDGKLASADSNDVWLFEFDSDASYDKGLVKAGSTIELLPSAALEKMTVDVKEYSAATFRLWGRVTKYREKNFIFPTYSLPLSKTNKSEEPKITGAEPTINEPNDALTIPREIIDKLGTRRIGTVKRPDDKTQSHPIVQQDFILADRIGFISSSVCRDAYFVKGKRGKGKGTTQYAIRNTQYGLFVLDALGRNAGRTSLQLLPCQALERTESVQSAEPETLRFKITGIVTKYKGVQYLLLQKATRVYSHGNFDY